MSDLDRALAALEARRTQDEAERQKRRRFACEFLQSFHENEVKPSAKLKTRGVTAWFDGAKLVLDRTEEGDFSEPLVIIVDEQGEIDAGGKSLGRFQPGEETEKKNALIAEIIAHFNF